MCQNETQRSKASKRSRTGCTNCRERRVQCDERRPACHKCIARDEACCYMPPAIPLRERRAASKARPGEQAPWSIETSSPSLSASSATSGVHSPASLMVVPAGSPAVSSPWRLSPRVALDPFDTLALDMPLRSKEFFYYYIHLDDRSSAWPGDLNGDCIVPANDPNTLRNTLLLAGLHYAWKFEDLCSVESTILCHKIQSIRLVNNWLVDKTSQANILLCAKYITTLCDIEAKTHLEGLMMYLDSRLPRGLNTNYDDCLEAELMNRYLILVYNILHNLKSRLRDYMASPESTGHVGNYSDPERLGHLLHEWHIHENNSHEVRLRALRLFPTFFSPTILGRKLQDIDVRRTLQCLHEVTATFDLRYSEAASDAAVKSPYYVWSEGGLSRLLYAMIDAHVESCAARPKRRASKQSKILSSWSSCTIVIDMYLISVLGIHNEGSPAESRLHRHTLRILKRDLERGLKDVVERDGVARDFWFWKLLIGSLSLTHASPVPSDQGFRDLLADFTYYIQQWVKATGVTKWKDAKKVLTSVVWPENFEREDLAVSFWNRVVVA
ncbi:hypothetical protein FZEAL_3877 [Fusarium zealandicum]|uniref:Zn(2)-C6 fungal-type domain-containing protein n=1 Tax=Fusarium zealandicum TaxID=1053134 RepID=A0A8H4XM45_9HYPO|nr:hypothetical protein FZEAL_3877 [Fusarium zealandicum]